MSAPASTIAMTALTLGLASAGGMVFWLLGLPAPWLSGAMVGATLGLIGRIELHLPSLLRDLAMLVLGLSMGSSVTPAMLADMAQWPVSLLALALVVAAIMITSIWTLRRWGWDRDTALYGSAPGALSAVLVLAAASSADMRRVGIAQSLRLFALVAVLPSVVIIIDPSAAAASLPPAVVPGQGLVTGPLEYVAFLAAGLAGYGLCYVLRVPAPLLIGAFLGSAIVHGTGTVTAPVPEVVLVPGFVVLGAFIALRFRGTTWAGLKADFSASLVALLVASLVAVMGAVAVNRLLGLPLAEALVAFAPGGIEAMIIMAFALKLDVAYVATHHIARFLGIALILPLVVRLLPPGKHRE
jgi:membrane AbrB-like protein